MATATVVLLVIGLLSECASAPGSSTPVASAANVITISSAACGTGWRQPTAGVQTLQIHNATASAVEVTLINPSNGAIYAKVEGVGPGTTRAMPVDLGSGVYAFACGGLNYTGINGPDFRVTGNVRGGIAILPTGLSAMITATAQARVYISNELATVVRQTVVLAAEIKAGRLAAAKSTWLTAHMSWERLGSAYGMFGAFDDEIDGTPFGLPGGVHDPDFSGFYRLEYGLCHGQSAFELTAPATTLSIDVRSLHTVYPGMALTLALTLSDLALRSMRSWRTRSSSSSVAG